MRNLILSVLLLFACQSIFSSEYDEAWKALHQNKREEAKEHLKKAMQQPATALDAYMTYLTLLTFEGKEEDLKDFKDKVFSLASDPYPYIFSLWFNEAVAGDYGKKEKPDQIKFLEKLIDKEDCNPSTRAAAYYMMGFHYMMSNQRSKALDIWEKIGSLQNWQFVGPFDNLSKNGFDRYAEPLDHPEKTFTFKSLTKADVNWFKPAYINNDGWIPVKFHFQSNNAIVFAQSFVNSAVDQEVTLSSGFGGTIKIWVNDELVISEKTERVTELDIYQNKCKLKKGYNRILVQLGYSTDVDYPNFMIRLLDNKGNLVEGLTSSADYQTYTSLKSNASNAPPVAKVPFAEAYFLDKIKAEPDNLINYLLLNGVYLRNRKVYESRSLMENALAKAPENSLLMYDMLLSLLKAQNRTRLSKEVERIKQLDPDCKLTFILKISNLNGEKKYSEVESEVKRYIDLFGEDEYILETAINLAVAQEKYQDVVEILNKAYDKYPTYVPFVQFTFNLQKNAYKDAKAAIKVLEKFLDKQFNYNLSSKLADEYFSSGASEKGLRLLKSIAELSPFDPDQANNLAKYYYSLQDYKNAKVWAQKAIDVCPYYAVYWQNMGYIEEQLNNKDVAIADLSKSIKYNPNLYTSRERLRTLQDKKELWKSFPDEDVYALIKKSKTPDNLYNYCYVLDEQFVIVYPEGASEETYVTVIKIFNKDGIDSWKEINIPFNSNTQELIIEKVEVVKANGNRINAETNENQVVFPNLEPGDAVYLKYKLQNYYYGRLADKFWDKYTFDGQEPVEMARYCLLTSSNNKFRFQVTKGEQQPQNTNIDNEYTMYTWERSELPRVETEPYAPAFNDKGIVLHLSNAASWKDITDWYKDLSYVEPEKDYDFEEAYNSIFPAGIKMTDTQKARAIYNYIETNIRYSSVSFRQSGFIPQTPSQTISTKLGDCKDVSELFVSLARKAGLKAWLVLINPRDKGLKSILLPSVDFNHCIAKVNLEGKDRYIELTDNNLPFAAFPDNLISASGLDIPYGNETSTGDTLKYIPRPSSSIQLAKRDINIDIIGNDLTFTTNTIVTGLLARNVKEKYVNLSTVKRKEEYEKKISSLYKNPIILKEISFSPLDNLNDTVTYTSTYTVKNELISIGELKSLKIPFTDVVASVDQFVKEDRLFPVEYWRYEDTDEYSSTLTIKAPAGMTFTDVPTDAKYDFKGSTYTISYKKKAPDQLLITRNAKLIRDDISVSEYKTFKEFLNKILQAESKYLGMK